MRQLTCEMCGGTDLIKQDGMFICQTCGTKYSVEEARKMMIEGTVSIVGTVSIDNSASYDRILELAKDAFEDKRWESAYNYYCQAVEIKQNEAESVLRQGLSILGKDGIQSSVPSSCINRVVHAIDLLKELPQEQGDSLIEGFIEDIHSVCDSVTDRLCEEIDDLESTKLATRSAGDILADFGRPAFIASQNQNEDKRIERHNNSVKEKIAAVRSRRAIVDSFETEYAEKLIECASVNLKFRLYYLRGELEDAYEIYSSITMSPQELKALLSEENRIYTAVKKRSVELVKMLISMGADVNDGSTEFCFSLFDIVANKCSDENKAASLEIVKLLMENGALINAEKTVGFRKFLNKDTDPDIKAYIISQRPELRDKFTEVKQSSGGCYVATAVYGSYDCPQVWTLRRYRDYTLAETWYGRVFIHTYYAISPTLVKWFGQTEWFKNMWKGTLDRMVSDLQSKGVESTPYEDREW